MRRAILMILPIVTSGWAAPLHGLEPADLRLVPFPKEVRLEAGAFALDRPLTLEVHQGSAQTLQAQVAAELASAGYARPALRQNEGLTLSLRHSDAREGPATAPPFRDDAGREDYSLRVGPAGVTATARTPAGLLHAASTLTQLIRANRSGHALPGLAIRDWPSIRWRAFQDDLTRGPSSTLDELKRQVRIGAGLKLNVFTYYMEHQYAFRKHPELGPPGGSLTPEELAALVACAQPLHVEIMGNQQSFGHFEHILKHEKHAPLRETPGVLTPVHEGTYALLDDMYAEIIPLLPFEFFNVCCDETWGLGTGPSRELAGRIGVGGVYVRHIRRVHELVRGRYGKRMMMWGDIILTHPQDLKDIPKDTIMMTWGYDPRSSFEDQIVPFARSGYEFFVCPGVNNWSRILPDFQATMVNVRNFVRDGVKHGALGVLNTAWDDDGETLNAPNWHGFAWGAECSWNAGTTRPEDFSRRVGAALFGEETDRFGQAVTALSQAHGLPGMRGMLNARFWQLDLGSASRADLEGGTAGKLLELTTRSIEHLEACAGEASANRELLPAVIFGARRMQLIGERLRGHAQAAVEYEQAYRSTPDADERLARIESKLRGLRESHASAGEQFVALWQKENRPYALDWTQRKYAAAVDSYDAILKRLAEARQQAREGKPLPPPEELGLSIPEPFARRTRPARTMEEPLEPQSPWAVPRATHRVGMIVAPSPSDRQDVPLELSVDRLEIDAPIRAFAMLPGAEPREVPAQILRRGEGGAGRAEGLVVVLTGRVPRDQPVQVFVYGGGEPAGNPKSAVSTSEGPGRGKWIETDQSRLLLAPEGGHVYRWELKALNGRDITMPGESGWQGCSDLGAPLRHHPTRLTCLAAGPAMVRYLCEDEDGPDKAVTVFAGTSWIEITLDTPVSYYWDFDDPRNFAADHPTPGQWAFSDGRSGNVGRAGDGVPAQARSPRTRWAAKYLENPPGGAARWALGLIAPETATTFVVGPGADAGGVGIEAGSPAAHFVTFAGPLDGPVEPLMERLRSTLDLRQRPQVTWYAVQTR